MNSNGFSVVTSWGFLLFGLGIFLVVVLMWCYDVNKKLNYILGRLNKIPKGREEMDLVALSGVSKSGKSIPLHVAFSIIAAAIILLFFIPLWLLNR